MKKLLFSALAVVVTLFATNSCVREPNYIEDPSQGVTVSYSVTLDQVQKTKTTLAELDDIAVDKLFYSVYQLTGTNTYTAIDHSDYHKAVDLSATGTADVTVKLIKGETYKVVFWAQKGTAYVSTIDKDHPLREITIDYTASDSYAADRDAFTAFDVITLNSTTPGTDYSSTFSKEIHLKRPFAQINFGADDVAQAAVQGYVAYSSVVSVKQAASKFNVTTGEASTPVDATFKSTVLPEVAVNFDINNVTYQRVAKAFVLPEGTFTVSNDGTAGTITSPLSTTPEVSLTLTVKKGENSLVLDPRSKSSVTVRSNYRTNLLGHLITTDATFQVVVDNDYEGSTDHVSIVSLGNASGNNEITMGDAEGISSDINFGEHPVVLNNTLTINGDVTISNGASLTVNAAIEVAEGATLTLDNVTIDNASTAPQIKVSKGATLIINGGTYTATDVDQLFNLLTSTISPAKIGRRDNSTKGELIIRGGTFMGDPTAYVDTDHYTVTDNNDGTFTVAQKPVTLTVASGDVSIKMGNGAIPKALTVDPADTDLSGISFEYSVANVASASYDSTSGEINIAAVGVGSTVITVKVGTATATINVTVLPADSILLTTNTLSVAKNATSDNITVTLNNDATVTEVVSDDPTKVKVNWESGNTFTVTGLAVTAEAVNVTVHASNALSATVAVSVYQPDAVKLAAPTLMATGVTKTDDEIELDWAPVEHASGYAVTVGQTALDGSKITTKANGDISADIEGLSPATDYVIKVVAVGDGVDYANSDEASITVTTEKGDVTIEVAQANSSYSIVKGLTATITGVSVKYAGSVIDVPVTYTLGTGASGKVTVEGTTITAVDIVDGAGINVVFAGNDTYNASTATDAIIVEVTEPVLESISLNSDELNVKKTFELNEAFTHENLVVTAHYNNNTTADVTAGATFSEVDMTTAGEKTVTVSYGGKSATYNITVNAAVVNPVDQTVNLTIGGVAVGETVNKVYGDASFTVVGSANNAVTFSSGTTSVAEITEAGVVTIKAVGSTVITATAAASAEYNETTKTFTLVVGKADLSAPTVQASAGTDKKITVSWDTVTGAASYTVKIGETETPNATSPFVTDALTNGTYAVSVKAIGDANHKDSAYSTAQNVEIADAQVTYTTIAQLKQAITATRSASNDTAKDDFDINVQNVYVSYVNGNNAYLQDASGAILLYKSGHNLTAGKTINGHITGSGCIYQGLYELVDYDATDATIGDGTVPTPAVVTVAQLNANLASYESQRVKLEGVTLKDAISNRAGTLVQGTDEIALYLKNSSATIPTGKTFDIIVYPGMHNEDKQVNIWAADGDITNMHNTTVVTTELSVADIEVKEGQDKSIVSTVNPSDAVITYALKTASDIQYVTVDSDNAKVHGVAKTTTPVVVVASVAALDGEYTAASFEFNVTVIEDNGGGDAVGTKYINEDFSSLTTWATQTSDSFDLSDGTWTASGAYSQSGCIKLGKSSASNTSITLPALSAMNDSSCDVTLTFKAVSSDSGYALSISTAGSETINPSSVSVTKHGSAINSGAQTASELATAFAASTAAFTVTISNATPSTVITISASNAKRWYIDDVVVEKAN